MQGDHEAIHYQHMYEDEEEEEEEVEEGEGFFDQLEATEGRIPV